MTAGFIHATTRTETTTTHTVSLDATTLVRLLNATLYADQPIPANAEVWFAVPGGANWSNTDIDIDSDNPINLRWTVSSTTTD